MLVKINPITSIEIYAFKEEAMRIDWKRVTFDNGGTNLKYGSFHDMKTDMTVSSCFLQ